MKNQMLSKTRIHRLRAQGYKSQTKQELTNMAFGIRFPYRFCVAIIVTAILTQSIVLFSAMLVIAFFGIVLPKHPFDYLFNYTLSQWINKPQLGTRSNQLKFACTIATLWLALVVYFLSVGQTTTALFLAGTLAFIAALPATIDFCLPSLIYNGIFQIKSQ